MTRALRLFAFTATLAVATCTHTPLTLQSISDTFARAEFLASKGKGADGWAEARRRQLLKIFLKNQAVKFHEVSDKDSSQGKYRKVALIVPGRGKAEPKQITLALFPTKEHTSNAAFIAQQRACDLQLISSLESLKHNLDQVKQMSFIVSETCIDLTPRREAQK